MDFKSYIRDIPDFPEKGVVFKDITPLLKDAKALQAVTNALMDLVEDQRIDKVVGMESRGFFYAPILASRLNAGFVPVRKDDVLATGGTAAAVCELVERLGGQVVQCVFLLQLDALNGTEKLHGYKVTSLLHY